MNMKVLIIGTMEIDGEEETGIFIKASIDEMRKYKHLFGEEVELKSKEIRIIQNPVDINGEKQNIS